MQEPSVRTSRLAIASGLAAAIVVGAAGYVIGRASVAPPPAPVTPAPPPVVTPPPAPVAPTPPVLARADLLELANAAADATASGAPLPAALGEAVGRRFALYLPFGCTGPAGADSPALYRWRYDAAAATLRLRVSSANWRGTDWWPTGTSPELEAIEGFWVGHPWASGETCPAVDPAAVPAGADPVTLPGQTLALAQFFPKGTSRQALRGGAPYETVLRIAPKELRVDRGFRLRLTGKIERVPGDGPVRCIQPAGIEQRPLCVVAVSFDELAIENPATTKTLATWTFGHGRTSGS